MRRRKRLRRKEIRKRRIIVITALFSVTFLLASGYAAFSTNLNINAKGNLIEKENTTIGGKKVYLATSGDGLYEDPVENNRYVYRGANPDNYICLESGNGACSNNNLYRIIAVEEDGTLKVIKNTSIGNIVWDPGYSSNISSITSVSSISGTRYSNVSTDYCYASSESGYYGCKSWGSRTSTYDSTGNTKVTQMPRAAGNSTLKSLPVYDSYINVYLNGGEYLNASNEEITITGWLESQNNIIRNNTINYTYNIGPLEEKSEQTLYINISQESAYKWKGKVGLMNATDYIRANNNVECNSAYQAIQTSCSTNNWLINSSIVQYMITPKSDANASNLIRVQSMSPLKLNSASTFNSYSIRPVFHLSSSITLLGKGTNDSNVYRIA